MKNKGLLITSFVALFAAIICLGNFMVIPVQPVPIVMQNALAILAGVIMGGFLGGAPAGLWLLASLILPVCAGGKTFFAAWIGPTGGFLPGYLIGAIVAGFIAGRPDVSQKKPDAVTIIRVSLAIIAGLVLLYVPGVIHFARWASAAGKVPEGVSAIAYTMKACVIPYLPGDAIKAAVCIPVALLIRPVIAMYLGSGNKRKENTENSQ